MVNAQDVIDLYQSFEVNGFQVWLTGGWGMDALLGEQTRPHKDLDILMLLDDVLHLRKLLERQGYTLKELWEENRWTADERGIETATAFVLQDPEGRELDIHAIRLDELGNGIPAWQDDEGIVFKKQDLAGEGRIASFAVRCISPEMQVILHMGYELPDQQVHDLELLNDKIR